MIIRKLLLVNYRNFEKQLVTFSPRLNFFVGENGQGKTNLLEAIYLLGHGTSFRSLDASDTSLVLQNQSQARLAARFEREDLEYDVQFNLNESGKAKYINGKKVLSTDQPLPMVLFSPESLSAIKEGPELRRRLVDSAIVLQTPRHSKLLRDFQKALRSRNRLLKTLQERSTAELVLTLESLNQIFLALATHVAAARLQVLRELEQDFYESAEFITSGQLGEISVDYVISEKSARGFTESELFDVLSQRHRQLAIREVAAGTSLIGPHKHDIHILINGKDSRFYASQGQQRALILALKIAQITYYKRTHGHYPLLLLDDVMSELDAERRNRLVRFLEKTTAQIIMTSTDLTWSAEFGFDNNSVFRVERGEICGGNDMALNQDEKELR